MLPRIAQLLQLRTQYGTATRDYLKITKAIDASQLSLANSSSAAYLRDAVGIESSADVIVAAVERRRQRSLGKLGNLNSLEDEDDFYAGIRLTPAKGGDAAVDDVSGGRRGGNLQGKHATHAAHEREELAAMRAETFRKQEYLRGIVKGARAQILFRKIPMLLSKIERLLKPNRELRAKLKARKLEKIEQKRLKHEEKLLLQQRAKSTTGHQSLSARSDLSRQAISASSVTATSSLMGAADPSSPSVDDEKSNLLMTAEDDEMVDLMFMGTADEASANGDIDASVRQQQQSALTPSTTPTSSAISPMGSSQESAMLQRQKQREADEADSFLFAGETDAAGKPILAATAASSTSAALPNKGRPIPLHQHVTLANVTRLLDTLAYFETQRQVFFSEQMAEYSRAMRELNNQIHMRHRALAKEYGRRVKRVARHGRADTFEQFAAADAKLAQWKKRLAETQQKEHVLKTSIIARPYTSALLWKAVLKFPILSEGCDPSLRVPYVRAVSRMLSGIMRIVTKEGSHNSVNSESPRFIASGTSSSSKAKDGEAEGRQEQSKTKKTAATPSNALATVSGANNSAVSTSAKKGGEGAWIPSPSKNATELLLLSLVRQAKVFDCIANDARDLKRSSSALTNNNAAPSYPFVSPATIAMLAESLVQTQRTVMSLIIALQTSSSNFNASSEYSQQVLALVRPTLGALNGAMTRAINAIVAALLPVGAAPTPPNANEVFCNKGLVEKLSPKAAFSLLSHLYQLKSFHKDTPKETRQLLYLIIKAAFPQASTRTFQTLSQPHVGGAGAKRGDDSAAFVTPAMRRALLKSGASLRDALRDPKVEARVEQRRLDATLRTRRLEQMAHRQSEVMGLTAPLSDLIAVYECLSHAATSCGLGDADTFSSSAGGRGVPSPIDVSVFKPKSEESVSWREVLQASIPFVSEAIIAKCAADRNLRENTRAEKKRNRTADGGDEDDKSSAIAAGMNLAQLSKLLTVSDPLLAEVRADPSSGQRKLHHKHAASMSTFGNGGGGGKGGTRGSKTAVAFYRFVLTEIKAKLALRLEQEVAVGKLNESTSLKSGGGKNDEAESLLQQVDADHIRRSAIAAPHPKTFVDIVASTGAVIASLPPTNVIVAEAKEVQQVCRALLIEDKALIGALRPLLREDGNSSVAGGNNGTDKGRNHTSARHSDFYSGLLDGFQQGGGLSTDFHTYLARL